MEHKLCRSKLEYIWLDGYQPTQSMRGKTMVVNNFSGKLADCPEWCFDGSSTKQAKGNSSDCLLKPVHLCNDPGRKNAYLVMCEVLNSDGTPHASNGRATIDDDDSDFWFGFEQEYVLWDLKKNQPLGFPGPGYFPAPQGPYYCSVGAGNAIGREIVEEHLDACIDAGLNIEGINAEVMKGQWEYQIFGKGAKKTGDEIWLSRYLMQRIGEKYDVSLDLRPKPVKGDWNGTGMHANFSNGIMRTCGKKEVFHAICDEFGKNIKKHMDVYGAGNRERLTGAHETQSYDQFSYGVSDRGASIRIPVTCVQNGYRGRLEDRRPASNADPYRVAAVIISTTKTGCNNYKDQ